MSTKFSPSKRRALTLFEVLGALFLAGILLSTVLHYFRDYSHTQANLSVTKQTVLSRSFTQLQLCKLFSKTEKDVYIDQNTLFFTCDNELDSDPHFSKQVKGSLYLNEKNELLVKLMGAEGQSREMVICHNVTSLSFKLFNLEWKDTWTKEDGLPSIVQLCINNDTCFSFFLPNASEVKYQ